MPNNKKQTSSDGVHLDRWHYQDFRDQKHDENYIEWKYFNFIQGDLAGYIVYYILDPENRTNIGGGRMIARIFKNSESLGSLKKLDVGRVQFDSKSAGVEMGGARIVEKNPYHYGILGSVDGLSWDLGYEQKIPTIQSYANINPGLLRWEKINWLVKMPSARVTGKIGTTKGTFRVDCRGYSDTNWGEIMPLFSRYEWGNYCGDKFSFVFGILYGLKKIKRVDFYVADGNHMESFENAKCKVEHSAWVKDKGTGLKVPSETKFLFSKDDYKVTLRSSLIQYDLLGLKALPLLPTSCVCEQLVNYTGTVEKNGQLIREFGGRGFEEWSTKTWRKIPILF